jgi:hypothetical protein
VSEAVHDAGDPGSGDGQRIVSIEALDEHGYAEWSVWAKKVVTL